MCIRDRDQHAAPGGRHRIGVKALPLELERGDGGNWASARRILTNRLVDAAVFENSEHAIATEGLAYDRCAIGVVTGFDASMRMPQARVETEAHLFSVVRTQVDLVLADGLAVALQLSLGLRSSEVLSLIHISEPTRPY